MRRMEYATVVWSPQRAKDIIKTERIRRKATNMVPSLKDLSFQETGKDGTPNNEDNRHSWQRGYNHLGRDGHDNKLKKQDVKKMSRSSAFNIDAQICGINLAKKLYRPKP